MTIFDHDSDCSCAACESMRHPTRTPPAQQPKEPTCTLKCPAIRDDKGQWYCRIQKAYVAPSEHHFNYGFDVVKEGKIAHSGYSTPCDAMRLFGSRPHPAPAEPLFSETTLERVRRQARSSFATTLHEQLKIKHKKGVVLTYDNVCDMIRESLRQEPPAP